MSRFITINNEVAVYSVLRMSVFLITVSLSMSLPGCSPSKHSVAGKSANFEQFDKNQLRAYYRYPDSPKYSVLPFSQVANVTAIIHALDFKPPLRLAQKQRLMEALYANIPQGVRHGPFANIAVGEYFDDGSPLLIRLGVFSPQPEFEPPADRIVMLQSNVVLGPSKQTTVKNAGRFVSFEKNYSKVYLLSADGRLVAQEDLYNEELEMTLQQESNVLLNKVIAANSFVRDERPENDHIARTILNEVLHSPEATPNLRIRASSNLFLYYLAQNDLENARTVRSQILSRGEHNYNESSITIMETDMPHMLELMKSCRKSH